jgi:uncharacterized membrane protein
MATNRLESFSDGVIAVAITLLVLGIGVPKTGARHTLGHELLAQWPQYAAYAVSFLTIGIIWINHHAMLSRLARADHTILILNLLLLMTIGLIPFATNLMADYLRAPSGQSLAAAVYSASLLLMSVTFSLLNYHILIAKAHLMADELSLPRRRQIFRRAVTGLIPYTIAIPVAFASPYVTLAICGALGLFYALPIASGRELSGGSPPVSTP